MALPTVIGGDGRAALPAFTSAASLARWRPGARPVPVPAAQVWQSGASDASAVVIDIAGPVPFAVDGARLAALAQGRPAPLPHEDPDVTALAREALAAEPVDRRIPAAARRGRDRPDAAAWFRCPVVTPGRGAGRRPAGGPAAAGRRG